MENLVIDIGNTATKAAWADGETIGRTFRYQGDKVAAFIQGLTAKVKPEIMLVSSAKSLPFSDIEVLEKECGKLVIMDSFHTALVSYYSLPTYLSPDRAASIIGARKMFKDRPCTLMDFGNTLTVDFIGEEGEYGGGNISPGCMTRFKAINKYSKSLPLIDAPEETVETGTSIPTSIAAGVISGILYEIEGYMRKKPKNIVVFTGGDAKYFAKRTKNPIFVVCNLVLMGLAAIADEYEKRIP